MPGEKPARSSRPTAGHIRQLFGQLDAATEPGEGHEPAHLLAETNRQDVFRELVWRMHNHPSPEVRYWCCYELCWEQPASAEFVEVLERQGEHPRIRGQACEGLGYVMEFARPTLAWYRRAEVALLKALDDPAVAVRWWSCFALGLAKSNQGSFSDLWFLPSTSGLPWRPSLVPASFSRSDSPKSPCDSNIPPR